MFFPIGTPFSYLMHHGLHYPILAYGLTPHPTMPMCHAILVVSLKPLDAFQNIAKRHYFCRPWFYASPNSVAMLSSNMTRYNSFLRVGHYS
jgi:hypothetical protein